MGLVCGRNRYKVEEEEKFSGVDRTFDTLVPDVPTGAVVARLRVEVVTCTLNHRFDVAAAGDPFTWLTLGAQRFRTRSSR